MIVRNPADDISTRALVNQMINIEGPVYMRLSRRKTEVIYNNFDEIFIDGNKISERGDFLKSVESSSNKNTEGEDDTFSFDNEKIFKIGKGIQIGDGKRLRNFVAAEMCTSRSFKSKENFSRKRHKRTRLRYVLNKTNRQRINN